MSTDPTISDELYEHLVAGGWTPPADVAEMARDEQEHIAHGGTPIGGSTGDGWVMVHIRHHGDTVVAVNATALEEAIASGEVPELLCDEIADSHETAFAQLDLAALLGGDR